MSNGWQVCNYGDGIPHVIPVNDLEPHFAIADCHCHPQRHPCTQESIVVHNSFDRREEHEPDRPLSVN